MRVYELATCLVLVTLSVATGARAQTALPSPAVTQDPLPLTLDLGRSKLDAEAVRRAIELELKRPIVITNEAADGASLSVIAHPNQTVTVAYRTSTGATRTRVIGVPADASRAAEVIALLSGNLSRDEAAQLLAELTPPKERVPTTKDEAEAAAQEAAPQTGAPPEITAAEKRPPPSPNRAPASAPNPLRETSFPAFNLSLVPPITLYRATEARILSAELGLGYSHVGELHGAGLNVFVLRTVRDVRGASFGTLFNDTGGTVAGMAGSALVNRRHRLRGFEFSGLLNLGSGDAEGFALTGLANLEREFEGFQAAGGVNWADRFQGLQAAGAFNRAGAFAGVQAAGGLNLAGSMSGLQVGVVNVAGDVHGLQVGVVNVAKRVRGTSIGLVSVADNGRVQPVVWVSSSLPLNLAAKFTVGPIYTQAGLGYAPGNQTYTYELGLGGHFPIGNFFLEPGVHYSEMRSASYPFGHELIEYGHYRVAAGLDFGQVSPFAGVGVLQRFAHSADAPASQPVTVEFLGGAAFF